MLFNIRDIVRRVKRRSICIVEGRVLDLTRASLLAKVQVIGAVVERKADDAALLEQVLLVEITRVPNVLADFSFSADDTVLTVVCSG